MEGDLLRFPRLKLEFALGLRAAPCFKPSCISFFVHYSPGSSIPHAPSLVHETRQVLPKEGTYKYSSFFVGPWAIAPLCPVAIASSENPITLSL